MTSRGRLIQLRFHRETRWVDDEDVYRCYDCKSKFTLWKRKHHCRKCGKVFCDSCCPTSNLSARHLSNLPSSSVLAKSPQTFLGLGMMMMNIRKKKRYCSLCVSALKEARRHETKINVLTAMANNRFLEIPSLWSLRLVSVGFHNAATELLSLVVSIPYALPFCTYSELDNNILRSNASFLCDNSRYHLALAQVGATYVQPSSTSYESTELRNLAHAFEVLGSSGAHQPLIDHARQVVESHEVGELDDFVLPLLSIIDEEFRHELLSNHLTLEAKFNNFWLIRSLDPPSAERLLHDDDLNEEIKHATVLMKILEKIASQKNPEKACRALQSYCSDHTFCRCPGMWELKVSRVSPHIITTSSKFSPVILTLEHQSTQRRVMLKKDDGVIDAIIAATAQLITQHLAPQHKLYSVLYRVVPIREKLSLLEVVPKCRSLNNICKRFGSVQDFLLKQNQHSTVQSLQNRFSKSTAFASILSFVLGLGDRHSANIMVTDDGRLFNVDLNYVLGKETGMRQFSYNKIKLTSDMLQMMGGNSSLCYQKFTLGCSDLFQTLRKNVRVLHIFLFKALVEKLGYCNENQYQEHFQKTLTPGESKKKASYAVLDRISHSSSSNARASEHILDTLHSFAKKMFQ